jgi:aryl-alcohol dehydrogenase
VSFDVNNLMILGKGIRGILEGESVPDIFIPQLIELNAQGRFPFEKLMKFSASTKSIKLRKTVKEGAQSSPSFAYQCRERERKLHVTGHKSRFLPRPAWP